MTSLGTSTGPVAAWVARRFGPPPGQPCTPLTRRCDFWNWGPGYVRPDCCTSHLAELTAFAHELLDRHRIVHWLDYGSLLGAVRDGHLIPWDKDADIGILSTDVPGLLSLAPEVERAGYRLDISCPSTLRINLSAINTQHVDLFPWTDTDGILSRSAAGDYAWPGMTGRDAFPSSFIESLESVVLEGIDLPAPSQVNRFLAEHRYGPGFRTPIRALNNAGWYPKILPAELTPALFSLFQSVERTETQLLNLERRRVGRLVSLDAYQRWVWSGRPVVPGPERLKSLGREWSGSETPAPAQQLLEVLALLEQAVEEYTSPSARTRAARAGRRTLKLARRMRGRLRHRWLIPRT
jgi:hypothetical protein